MSSTPALIHGEYVNRMLILAAAATTFVGYASSVYWERTVAPYLFRRRELALEQEIADLVREAKEICTTSNLYEHSRLMRRVLRLRQELEAERQQRLTYEFSVARVFSPLLSGVSFASWFARPTRDAAAVAIAPGRVGKAIAGNKPGALPDLCSTTITSSPTRAHAAEYSATAPRRLQVLVESAMNALRYNATTTVKYLLRFGSALVLLYVFGNRRGLMAVPPSFEETLRYCAVEVMAPLLLNVFMYVPALLFAPARRASLVETHGSKAAGGAVGVIHSSFAEAIPPSSSASSFSTVTSSASDAGTTAPFQRADIRFCARNDLASWFLACYLAWYLIVRVFG
ncbi:hypothetical protein, conserved [Leishmania donovani]|uniref:Uncharacterized protein n=1 Tax=Leishmania donovani TaxID=5661 RepID=E9BQ21_LEIDO|nr:hypothetical protein, conserved [Leishmania donovani]TPP53778.1 hypothetical protein CGC21_38145 [Leishmania donovani]CBZ37233.1 hypothetical protein, conserved [Leishmania donovani]